MKTYLSVASHWACPPIRQCGTASVEAANRQAVDYFNDLLPEVRKLAGEINDAEAAKLALCVLPATPLAYGDDWKRWLRGLQLVRLLSYFDGDGAIQDVNCWLLNGEADPALMLNLDGTRFQALIDDGVAEDDRLESDAKLGFPMIWIEEPESRDDEPPVDGNLCELRDAARALLDAFGGDTPHWLRPEAAKLESALTLAFPEAPALTERNADTSDVGLVLELADRFLSEGDLADASMETRAPYIAAIDRLRSSFGVDVPFTPAFDIGQMLSVIGWAEQFTTDWYEHAAPLTDEPEMAAKALNTVAAVKASVLACGDAKPIRVLVNISGGLLQGASADVPIDLISVDYDTDGSDEERLVDVPQSGGGTAEGIIGGIAVAVEPDWIDAVQAAAEEGTDNAG
jgi:hypothetical protein